MTLIRSLSARSMSRGIAMAALLCGVPHFAAAAAQQTAVFQTPARAFTEAMRYSIGAPARADLGDQAVVRLAEDLIIVPHDQAARLLKIWNVPVPPDMVGLLLGPKGMAAPAVVRFVPAGFVDTAEALRWTADDLLSSLADTIRQGNIERAQNQLPQLEARRWVQAPRTNATTNQIIWAALVLDKSADEGADGEITYNAIGFGRHGYIQVSVRTSLQDATDAGGMLETFLEGLTFRPGASYGDVQPGDPRAAGGLAAALGMVSLHRASRNPVFLRSDLVIPYAGTFVGLVGAVSLLVYVRRHLRRESRRW